MEGVQGALGFLPAWMLQAWASRPQQGSVGDRIVDDRGQEILALWRRASAG